MGNTLTVVYNSSLPKSKAVVKVKKTRYRDVLTPGQEKAYSLKPGEYQVRIRIGLLRRYRKWAIIAPSEEPVCIQVNYIKGETEARIFVIQSSYSATIAKLLEEKKRKEFNEMNYLAKSLKEFGVAKMLLFLVFSILACIFMTPMAIKTMIRFFTMLFNG